MEENPAYAGLFKKSNSYWRNKNYFWSNKNYLCLSKPFHKQILERESPNPMMLQKEL